MLGPTAEELPRLRVTEFAPRPKTEAHLGPRSRDTPRRRLGLLGTWSAEWFATEPLSQLMGGGS
jgi:hypothetical protein